MAGLLLAGCTLPFVGRVGPEPVPTADLRPTFPPTFTPSPTITPVVIPTETPTFTPTVTLTLTPTIAPVDTATSTPSPSPTATWTPDLRTSTPGGPLDTPSGSGTPASVGCGGRPVGDNLLNNPGFEGGQTAQDGIDSVRVPDGWTGFWLPEGTPTDYDQENPDGFRRPDMQVISKQPPYDNPPRVRSGDQAFLLSGANKVFDGGLLQQVRVIVGVPYCVSGYAHAWSSHKSDDPFHSQLDTPDDQINVTFLLGVDPTGGLNPWSPTVRWGAVGRLYDTYQAIPSLRVVSESETITVFVRGSTRWRFDHNDLFFDDIGLFQLDR